METLGLMSALGQNFFVLKRRWYNMARKRKDVRNITLSDFYCTKCGMKGIPVFEIAEMLDKSLPNVEKLLWRAKKKLEMQLREMEVL
jgi:DNA-binding CsgD family transcriptional regulator